MSRNKSLYKVLQNKDAKMDQVSKNIETLYEELRFGRFSYGNKREKFDTLLYEFLSMVKPEDRLFDVGCGAGDYMEIYIKHGIRKDQITGVDLAPSNISDLNKRGYKALCDDLLNLKLEDNVTKFTICQGVIHHTVDPYKAFTELVRITKGGGYLYLNVYSKWHPFFYLIHRATFPIRWFYWNCSKKIVDFIYPISKIIFQPLAYLALGEFLDDNTGKIHFKDQILTPQIHLFSKSDIESYAEKQNCTLEKFSYNRYHLMLSAIMKVNK